MGLSTCILLDVRMAGPWARREELILQRLAPARMVPVADAGAAQAAAFEAAMAGCERLIAADGPGSAGVAHGLLNGVMRLAESHRRRLRVGLLGLGRPGALQRTLGQAPQLMRQLDVLSAGNTLPLDVGRVECAGGEGPRYFLCGAWLGPGAQERRPDGPPFQAGARRGPALLQALLQTLAGLAQPTPRVRLLLDDRVAHDGPLSLGVVMVGQHYPALGRLAQDADPMDGALDVAWIAGGASALLARLPGLWLDAALSRAVRLPAPHRARALQVRALQVEIPPLARPGPEGSAAQGGPALKIALEADGQPVGWLPATITLVPKALPIIVEAVPIRLEEKQRAMLAELQGTALAGHWRGSAVAGR